MFHMLEDMCISIYWWHFFRTFHAVSGHPSSLSHGEGNMKTRPSW